MTPISRAAAGGWGGGSRRVIRSACRAAVGRGRVGFRRLDPAGWISPVGSRWLDFAGWIPQGLRRVARFDIDTLGSDSWASLLHLEVREFRCESPSSKLSIFFWSE